MGTALAALLGVGIVAGGLIGVEALISGRGR